MSSIIRGRQVQLDEQRSVFVGERDGCDNTYLRFVNDLNQETKLRLSPEATEALRKILTDHGAGEQHEITLLERGEQVWAAVEEKAAP